MYMLLPKIRITTASDDDSFEKFQNEYNAGRAVLNEATQIEQEPDSVHTKVPTENNNDYVHSLDQLNY